MEFIEAPACSDQSREYESLLFPLVLIDILNAAASEGNNCGSLIVLLSFLWHQVPSECDYHFRLTHYLSAEVSSVSCFSFSPILSQPVLVLPLFDSF